VPDYGFVEPKHVAQCCIAVVSDGISGLYFSYKGKGKFHPRRGHEDSEGEYRYSSTLSLTSAVNGAGWSTPRPGRFTPGEYPVPIVKEAG
jgi:hypothetical protein